MEKQEHEEEWRRYAKEREEERICLRNSEVQTEQGTKN